MAGKLALGVNPAQSFLTPQAGTWGQWEEEPDTGLPLLFLYLSIFFFSCLPPHPRIDQPHLKPCSGGCALSRDRASRVRPLVCWQCPKGGVRGVGLRGAEASPCCGKCSCAHSPSPSLKNKPAGDSIKGEAQHSNSREWLIFYYWEEIFSLCE